MGKNIGKNVSKNLSSKYKQKLLDHAKQSTTDVFKTASKRVIKKTAEANGNFIGNKTADQVTKVARTPSHNNLKVVEMKQKILILIEIYLKKNIYLQKKDKKL